MPKVLFKFLCFFLFLIYSLSFCMLRKNHCKMWMHVWVKLKLGVQNGHIKADLCTNHGANPIKISEVITNRLRKTRSICCHAYRSPLRGMSWNLAHRWSNYHRSAFSWFEINREKDLRGMKAIQPCVKIMQSIFVNKNLLVFMCTRQTA